MGNDAPDQHPHPYGQARKTKDVKLNLRAEIILLTYFLIEKVIN